MPSTKGKPTDQELHDKITEGKCLRLARVRLQGAMIAVLPSRAAPRAAVSRRERPGHAPPPELTHVKTSR
jgi:hypothetical protein